MEIIDPQQKQDYEFRKNPRFYPGSRTDARGRIFAGLILLAIGAVWLARRMGVDMPDWLFHWPTILVAVGLFVGAKHNFVPGGWLILILIGVLFWFEDWMPDFRPYFLPVAVIIVGIFMIISPRRRRRYGCHQSWKYRGSGFTPKTETESAQEKTTSTSGNPEMLESVSIFGNNKRRISSQHFNGGESVSIFGGAEIDLSQADIQGQVKLELVQIFGGTKLILPPHWLVQSEMVSVFGSVEDTRTIRNDSTDTGKVIILEGFSFMGSIQIKSF